MARSAVRRGVYIAQVMGLGAAVLAFGWTTPHQSSSGQRSSGQRSGEATAGTAPELRFDPSPAIESAVPTTPPLEFDPPTAGGVGATAIPVGQVGGATVKTIKPASSSSAEISIAGLKKVVAYDGSLKAGWSDLGWSASRVVGRGAARIDMGEQQGWIVARRGKPLNATVLRFRYRTEKPLGQILYVTLGSSTVEQTAELGVANLVPDANGWYNATLSVAALNPKNLPYDRIRIRPTQRRPSPFIVEIDKIVFFEPKGGAAPTNVAVPTSSKASRSAGGAPAVGGPATGQAMSIDCADARHQINPNIYGIGYSGVANLPDTPWTVGASINRWGGNPTSRYNWQLPNAWNTANDYFFRNVEINAEADASEAFLANNRRYGMLSAVTLPMLGWVAKDTTSYSFPVSKFGQQKATDPSNGDIGDGLAIDGRPLSPGSPKATSVASTPETVKAWVQKLRGRASMYFLDNEPELWDSTHRDVHPDPLTYDELLDKSVRYATVIRAADPTAVIAGPSSWGWPAYFWSGADAKAGFDRAPDRRAHANMALLPWYLQEMRAAEKRAGVKLLDVLDVHFYPAGERVYEGGAGGTDPETAALRIRQVRGLWDPSYSDESWVGEPIYLIPRLRDWVSRYAPGVGISIGEWNFGGENHISGALATAEALGRFGTENVASAYYWTSPPTNSASYWAFRAYRNYDGQGGRFLDTSLATVMGTDLSLFASTNSNRSEITAVILNTNATKAQSPNITLNNCRSATSVESFVYTGGTAGLAARSATTGNGGATIPVSLPAYSLTVLHVRLG